MGRSRKGLTIQTSEVSCGLWLTHKFYFGNHRYGKHIYIFLFNIQFIQNLSNFGVKIF